MAKRFERHSRRKRDDWGPVRTRLAERSAAIAEAPKRPRRRKETRRWCKGITGREHTAEVVFEPMFPGRSCGKAMGWLGARDGWGCHHRECCSACGRVLRDRYELGRECPDYPADGNWHVDDR